MFQAGTGASPPRGRRHWIVLGAIGLIAVATGIVLPQALVGDGPVMPPAQAAAPAGLEYTPAPLPEPPNAGAMLFRLTAGTVVVLGLCVATLWAGQRWIRREPAPTAGGPLVVVGSLALGNRCSVVLFRTGNRQVLAGMDGSGLKVLVPLSDQFDEALAEAEGGGPAFPAGE